jgi:hypothetical protein
VGRGMDGCDPELVDRRHGFLENRIAAEPTGAPRNAD